MDLFGVYGASGFGREVMPLLRSMVSRQPEAKCVFVDDAGKFDRVNGYECMTFERFRSYSARKRSMVIAIANGSTRKTLARSCADADIGFINVLSERSVMMDEVQFSEGLILCSFSTITSNVKIGRHFHANIYSYVAHDCVIGDFVTFAPSVMCNGNVHVGDHAYIGTGAILRQGQPGKPLVIGEGAIVGMGAVVTRDVPPGVTVVGNPAKPLIKH